MHLFTFMIMLHFHPKSKRNRKFFLHGHIIFQPILSIQNNIRAFYLFCHFILFSVMQYFYPQASHAKYNWFISIGFGTKCDQIHSEIHASCFQHHFSYWIQIRLKCYWLYDYWQWFEVYFWFCVSYRRELLRCFTLCLKIMTKSPSQVGKNWFNAASSSEVIQREYGQSGCFICSSL